MRQSGADAVVTSSDAVGRLLGLSSLSPTLGAVMEDLLSYGEGLEVAERDLLVQEVGKQPQSLPDQVIAVVRDGAVHRYFDPAVTQLVRGDRLVVVRPAEELPWAPRPGTHGEARPPTRRTEPAGPSVLSGSAASIRAWRASPYRALRIYVEDVPRSCAQPQLTPRWVADVSSQGRRLVPIYKGLQPWCRGKPSDAKITPTARPPKAPPPGWTPSPVGGGPAGQAVPRRPRRDLRRGDPRHRQRPVRRPGGHGRPPLHRDHLQPTSASVPVPVPGDRCRQRHDSRRPGRALRTRRGRAERRAGLGGVPGSRLAGRRDDGVGPARERPVGQRPLPGHPGRPGFSPPVPHC